MKLSPIYLRASLFFVRRTWLVARPVMKVSAYFAVREMDIRDLCYG